MVIFLKCDHVGKWCFVIKYCYFEIEVAVFYLQLLFEEEHCGSFGIIFLHPLRNH